MFLNDFSKWQLGSLEGRSLCPACTMTEVDPGLRVSAEACWALGLGGFQSKGTTLREVNRVGNSGLQTSLTCGSRLKATGSEGCGPSSSPGASSAKALLNVLPARVCPSWNTFVCHFLQEGVPGLCSSLSPPQPFLVLLGPLRISLCR